MSRRLIPTVIALFLAAGVGLAGDEETARITIRITGVESLEGQVVLQVYDDPATFLQQSAKAYQVPLADADLDGPIETTIELPLKQLGICAYHDRNGNGRIDRTMLGVPREPYGWTRGAHPRWAPPTWQEVTLTVEPDMEPIAISLDDW